MVYIPLNAAKDCRKADSKAVRLSISKVSLHNFERVLFQFGGQSQKGLGVALTTVMLSLLQPYGVEQLAKKPT